MRTKLLLAVLLSLFLTGAAGAAITVTIELPTNGQVVGPGPDVRAAVTSTLSLQSVVAAVETYSAPLTLSAGKWIGFVNINGLSRGNHTLTVTATDVNGNTASDSRTIFLDYYPVVTVTSPLPYSVGRPYVQYTATCTDDDPAGCASLRIAQTNNLTTRYQSPNPASLNVILTASFNDRIVGTDSAGRTIVVETPSYTELSSRLRTVANAPTVIRDFDGTRLLHTNQFNNDWRLGIYNIATGANDPMVSAAKADTQAAYLTPTGAIFVTTGNTVLDRELREWRNGALTPGIAAASTAELNVQGTWASYLAYTGFYHSFVRRDLTTGTDTTLDTQAAASFSDVAPNGHTVWLHRTDSPGGVHYDVYRNDGTTSTNIDGDANLKGSLRTDGGDVAYWKGATTESGAVYVNNGSGAVAISPVFNGSTSLDVKNDWVVFQMPDISGNRQLWRRAPGTSSSTQVTQFNNWHQLMQLAGNGQFVYRLSTTGGPEFRHFLAGTTYDTNAIPLTKNSNMDDFFFVNNRWWAALGRMLFQVEPPNDDFSSDFHSDVLWRDTTNGQLELWSMFGATPDTYPYLPAIGSPWVSQTGDFNGDGNADILWRNPTTGQISMWFLVNKVIVGGANLPTLPSAWETYPGDYNGDGTDDLLLRNTSTSQVSMWMLQNGTIVAGGNLPSLPLPWKLYAGDFNADGKSDVYLQNPSTADNTIWFLSGASIIGGKPMPNIPAPWEAYVGSYNGDPNADILWRNTSSGDSSIWLMQSGNIVAGGDLPNMPTSAIPYRGDFNNDGNTDLFWHTPGSTGITIMMMNGTAVASTHSLARAANNEVMNLK